jgi:hypothetical protein
MQHQQRDEAFAAHSQLVRSSYTAPSQLVRSLFAARSQLVRSRSQLVRSSYAARSQLVRSSYIARSQLVRSSFAARSLLVRKTRRSVAVYTHPMAAMILFNVLFLNYDFNYLCLYVGSKRTVSIEKIQREENISHLYSQIKKIRQLKIM